MFWWNKNGFETSHYVILAYFVLTLTGYNGRTAVGKVIQLGARDTNKLWGCIIPADQSAG